MLDLKSQLNEQQVKAAAHVNGPLLVIAGAGSGKTRVITYRIANLVQNHGVKPWRIMAVTFTNKAAKEMLERVEELLGHDAHCWVSTFHASCARILRKYGAEAGINPKFTIYDDQDQKAMVTRVLKELNMSTKQFPPRAIQSEINKSKRELTSPEDYPESDFYRRHVKQVYALYEKRMKDASALDFADLLYRTVRAMQDNENLAREINGQFDYVLVDEFQDTNRVQLELVRLLTPHRNICVVGDDDQSIYSWRGADVSNILDFEKLFNGAKAVTLDRNYRSTQHILKAAHGVVTKLPGRRPKELWTDNHDGDQISLLVTPDEREEGRQVVKKVRELRNKGVPYSQQAVFYRTNAQSRVFEEVFRSYNIPHRIVGGMRFYERAEVKDLIAYLRLVQNPKDHAAFTRIINTPTRGIGKTTVDKLVALAGGLGISAFEAIGKTSATDLAGAATKKLTAFADMVTQWQQDTAEDPFLLLSRIIEDIQLIQRLEKENTAEADARIENIKELAGSVEDFVADAETPTLENFLELVALQSDVDAAKFDGEEVTLMTVHAAKGLEFDTVFVTGLEEGLFPLIRQDEAMLGESDAIDEERRLGYVAITRARKQVILTRARTRRLYGNTRTNPPSRFIADIPPSIIRDISPKAPKVSLLGSRAPSAAFTRPKPAWTPGNPPSPGVPKSKPRKTDDTWIDTSFDQSASSSPQLFPGQYVSHARFGRGKIMGVHPGAKPKVDVQFPGFGKKTILVAYLELG